MRILLLIRSLEIGGAERQIVELARSLKRTGAEVEVVTFYRGGNLERELVGHGISCSSPDKRGRFDLLGFGLRLAYSLRARRPTIVYGFLPTSNIVLALLKPFLRGAFVVWGVRASNVDGDRYDFVTRLSYRIEAALAGQADLIIANSFVGKETAATRGFPGDRIVVISNGIDVQRFQFDPDGRRRVRAEFGIGDDEQVIGLAARLDPMKDHANLMHAAVALAKRVPKVRFLCVGGGAERYRTHLHRLGGNLGVSDRIIWAQERNDMPAVYSAFDVGCSSSSFGEGFSNAVAEAMACERPCVVTDVGDSAYIVGGTGEVVPPCDPASLAQGLQRLLAADLAGMGRQARERIMEHFNGQELGRKTLAALSQWRPHRPEGE